MVETTSPSAIRMAAVVMWVAALIVAVMQVVETHPSADRFTDAISAADVRLIPRCANRERSSSWARDSRRRTVASPQFSSRAAWVWVLPSRSQSKTGSRYLSESRATSSCRTRYDSSSRAVCVRSSTCRSSTNRSRPRCSARSALRLKGDTIGDAVQPSTQGVPPANRPSLADEHQKRCLEGIFGGIMVPDNGPASTKNHRRMPINQCREGGLITTVEKPLEELAIG